MKRLRPADMVPYRYDRWMPTPWLWVSEGITDYYADLALVRAGVIDSAEFLALTAGKIQEVADVPVVSLEDASLSTWIGMTDGTGSIYYPKGSLAGMLLDILIRDASDNRKSLDDVMRTLYRSHLQEGQGVHRRRSGGPRCRRRPAASRSTDFNARYIDGREPFPYATDFALAGITFVVDSNRIPRVGIQTRGDSTPEVVVGMSPGGAFAAAGGLVGDELVRVGDVEVAGGDWAPKFRTRYGASAEGTVVPVVVRRGGQPVTLPMALRFVTVRSYRLVPDPNASPAAVQVRQGIMRGTVAK